MSKGLEFFLSPGLFSSEFKFIYVSVVMWYILIMWSELSRTWLVGSPHAHYLIKSITAGWWVIPGLIHLETDIPQWWQLQDRSVFMYPFWWIILTQRSQNSRVAKFLAHAGSSEWNVNAMFLFLFLPGDRDNIHWLY